MRLSLPIAHKEKLYLGPDQRSVVENAARLDRNLEEKMRLSEATPELNPLVQARLPRGFEASTAWRSPAVPQIYEQALSDLYRTHPLPSAARTPADELFGHSSKVREAQIECLAWLGAHAQPSPRRMLFATTSRCLDRFVPAAGLELLFKDVIDRGKSSSLIEKIDKGPSSEKGDPHRLGWKNPQDEIEFLASVVRFAVTGEGKLRIRAKDNVLNWIKDVLEREGFDSRSRVGGASAVGAHLGPTFGFKASMLALGKMPAEIIGPHEKGMLPGDTVCVNDRGELVQASALRTRPASGGHANLLFAGFKLPPELGDHIIVNGRPYSSACISGDDVLGTSQHSTTRGFNGISPKQLEKLGQAHDMLILTGLQHLRNSRTEPAALDDHSELPAGFVSCLESIKKSGCRITLLYSDPRDPSDASPQIEAFAAAKQRRTIDVLCIRPDEGFRLLDILGKASPNLLEALAVSPELHARIKNVVEHQENLSDPALTKQIYTTTSDEPTFVCSCAELLNEALGIPIVRVRGRMVDVAVVDRRSVDLAEKDRALLENAMIFSRHQGAAKVANDIGLLTKPTFVPTWITPKSIYAFNVAAQSNEERGYIRDGDSYTFYNRETKRNLFVTPTPEMLCKDGATVSAGDVMDTVFALFLRRLPSSTFGPGK